MVTARTRAAVRASLKPGALPARGAPSNSLEKHVRDIDARPVAEEAEGRVEPAARAAAADILEREQEIDVGVVFARGAEIAHLILVADHVHVHLLEPVDALAVDMVAVYQLLHEGDRAHLAAQRRVEAN